MSLLVSSLHTFIHHLAPYSAEIYGLTNEQQAIAMANFEKLGPIARICIDFAKDPGRLPAYKQYSEAVITDLTPQSFPRFALNGGALHNPDEEQVSNSMDQDDSPSQISLFFPHKLAFIQLTVADKHDIKRAIEDSFPAKEVLAVCVHLPSWLRGRCQRNSCGEEILGWSHAVLSALGDRATNDRRPPTRRIRQVRGQNDPWMEVCRI